jgi:hypothetical protein
MASKRASAVVAPNRQIRLYFCLAGLDFGGSFINGYPEIVFGFPKDISVNSHGVRQINLKSKCVR